MGVWLYYEIKHPEWRLTGQYPFTPTEGHSRHFQLNPILILEFDIGVRIMFLVDILKDNM